MNVPCSECGRAFAVYTSGTKCLCEDCYELECREMLRKDKEQEEYFE